MDPTRPFALIWDRSAQAARLFTRPTEIVTAETPAAVAPALARLRALAMASHWLAGGLAYEAGLALEPKLADLAKDGDLLWFAAFPAPETLDFAATTALLDRFARPTSLGAIDPGVTPEWHAAAVHRVQALIAAGDIYQANLTFPVSLATAGHPLALFRRLFSPAAAPYAALVHRGDGRWWISLSPELFFTLDAGRLTSRPMKGTARRHPDPAADARIARALAADPKNRAENLMITDLIRNDLARVSRPGSVRVPSLFTVETYPSVHQLTSTVTADLAAGHDALDALAALFPCGSITGAPKIRAMQVIAEVEERPRGLYCGSIGWIGPHAQSAAFNVAIRTLVVTPGHTQLGLGSGLVADSRAPDEWRECLVKARFLAPAAPTALIETMRREADGQIPRLARHLDRLAASAARFAFRFDRAHILARLAALPPASNAQRLRLLLAPAGHLALHLAPAPPPPEAPLRLALQPLATPAEDWRLAHKCNARAPYTAALAAARAAGADEALLVRADGHATEGSFTSLFVEDSGRLLTPPLAHGLLPGVLRAELLASGRAVEAPLHISRLPAAARTGRLFVGNSLRGLLPAILP